MTYRKTGKTQARGKPSPEFGIKKRSYIRASKANLERLARLRFHCNLCKNWLPALAFYTQVAHSENEVPDDAVYLARYEAKVEGFKGRETVVVCEDCAEDMSQD
jgi:hypothetical protein